MSAAVLGEGAPVVVLGEDGGVVVLGEDGGVVVLDGCCSRASARRSPPVVPGETAITPANTSTATAAAATTAAPMTPAPTT